MKLFLAFLYTIVLGISYQLVIYSHPDLITSDKTFMTILYSLMVSATFVFLFLTLKDIIEIQQARKRMDQRYKYNGKTKY